MLEMPLGDTEILKLWAKHKSGQQLSTFEINSLFDNMFHMHGRFEFIAKITRDYRDKDLKLKEIVEAWIKDVAYAEDDFVLSEHLVKELLDKLHPHWRLIFNKKNKEEDIFAKFSVADLVAIKLIADGSVKNKDVFVEFEED